MALRHRCCIAKTLGSFRVYCYIMLDTHRRVQNFISEMAIYRRLPTLPDTLDPHHPPPAEPQELILEYNVNFIVVIKLKAST